MMKKAIEEAKLEVIYLNEDIITASKTMAGDDTIINDGGNEF